MKDLKHKGRPAKVPNKKIYIIATEWTQQGVGRGANNRPYRSMEEVSEPAPATSAAAAPRPCRAVPAAALPPAEPLPHRVLQAMEKHEQLKELVQNKHLTADYLKRRCKEVVPGWRIGPLPEKIAFKPERKRERRAYSERAVQYPMEQWQSTVFLDEHKFFRRPIALPAIHIAGQRRRRRRMIKDPRKKRYPWSYPKLHFFYGVHWKLGVLGPYWVSDCKGWKHAKTWKVRCPGSPAATSARWLCCLSGGLSSTQSRS